MPPQPSLARWRGAAIGPRAFPAAWIPSIPKNLLSNTRTREDLYLEAELNLEQEVFANRTVTSLIPCSDARCREQQQAAWGKLSVALHFSSNFLHDAAAVRVPADFQTFLLWSHVSQGKALLNLCNLLQKCFHTK